MNSIYKIRHFALIAVLYCINPLYSATKTWTGGTSTSWTTNSNWAGNSVPGTGDTVVINAGSSNYPALSLASSSVTISRLRLNGGSLTLSGGNNFTVSRSAFITGGTFTANNTGTVTINGDLFISGGTFTKASGNISIGNELNMSNGTFSKSVSPATLTIGDDIIMTGGTFNANSGSINIDNDMDMSAGTFNGGTATIGSSSTTNTIAISGGTFNAATVTAIRCQYLNMTGGTINAAGNKFNVSVTATLDGASLNISAADMYLSDNFTMVSGTLDLNSFKMTIDGRFTYNGGSIVDPATNIDLNNFTVNFTGTFTLNFTLNVDGDITFTKGILKTSASNLLILSAGSNVSSASNTSHVAGPVRKLVDNVGVFNQSPFAFPTGNGSVYAPIEISGFSSGRDQDYFTAQYDKDGAPYDHTSKDNSIHHISDAEYWVLDRAATSGTPTTSVYVKLYYSSTRSGSVTSTSNLKITKWDGSTWKDLAAGVTSGSNGTAGSMTTSSRVTSFSPFTFASGSTANPLPVSLVDFNGALENKEVKLSWTTISEVNNKFFTVQKSVDGKIWRVIGIVNAAANPEIVNHYTLTDRNPVQGLQYYRLIQTDISGESTTCKDLVSVNMLGDQLPNTVSSSPNPVKDVVTVSLNTASSDAGIVIYNSMGVKVMELNNLSGAFFQADLSKLPNGIYVMEIRADNQVHVSKIIKTN